LISFTSPTPERAEYLGRNHRFVATLARYLMEDALTRSGAAAAARCGAIRTRGVTRLTTIWLLRIRYLVKQPDRAPLLSEEVCVLGASRSAGGKTDWLSQSDVLRLLAQAQPEANLPLPEKKQLIAAALDAWPGLAPGLEQWVGLRAQDLEESHKRVRQAVSLKVRQLAVEPQFPPDLLGILVLQPLVS
jgi:hypothetical protein